MPTAALVILSTLVWVILNMIIIGSESDKDGIEVAKESLIRTFWEFIAVLTFLALRSVVPYV